jgi:hypothetical protein
MDIINSKAISTTNRLKSKTDRINNGWIYLIESQNGFDTTLVDINKLKKIAILDENVRLNLMNDAIAYIGSNSRNLVLLKSLEEEIFTMQTILETKCITND